MEQNFIIANRTDRGRVREVNEDSMVTFDSPNGRVIAVCDGMGGQAAGDVASRLACDIITDILTNNTFSTPQEAITRACVAANQGIVHKASQDPNLEGMGATCVMVIIKNGLVYYGWIGDSRIYYIANGSIQQLTKDQSYVQQLVDQGNITPEEAEHHPQKNQILNALGMTNMQPPAVCQEPLTPAPGSVILLCSDGLSGMVDNETIRAIITTQGTTLQQRADTLVNQANANGGIDNVTVQLVQFGKDGAGAGARRAASSRSAASAGVLNGKYTMWGMIVGAVIIAAAIIIWAFAGNRDDDDEKASAKLNPIKIETTTPSTPAKSSAPSQSQQAPKQASQPKAKDNKNSKKPERVDRFGKQQQQPSKSQNATQTLGGLNGGSRDEVDITEKNRPKPTPEPKPDPKPDANPDQQ